MNYNQDSIIRHKLCKFYPGSMKKGLMTTRNNKHPTSICSTVLTIALELHSSVALVFGDTFGSSASSHTFITTGAKERLVLLPPARV